MANSINETVAFFQRQKLWADFFVELGLPVVSASALVGEVSEENNAQPVTEGPLDHGSNGGFQWRGDRLDGPKGLKAYCAAKGLDWKTIKAQARFFLWECRDQYPSLYEDLVHGLENRFPGRPASQQLATLVANVMNMYEQPNPALAHFDVRLKYARDFLARYVPQNIPATPVIPTAPTGDFVMTPQEIMLMIEGVMKLIGLIETIVKTQGTGIQHTTLTTGNSSDIDNLAKKIADLLQQGAPK